jgi:hypothetical protein
MEFPDDVLATIKDFSRPITRSDWRSFHPMNSEQFHFDIARCYNVKRIPVIESFVKRYDQVNFVYIFHLGYIMNTVNCA